VAGVLFVFFLLLTNTVPFLKNQRSGWIEQTQAVKLKQKTIKKHTTQKGCGKSTGGEPSRPTKQWWQKTFRIAAVPPTPGPAKAQPAQKFDGKSSNDWDCTTVVKKIASFDGDEVEI